MQKNSNALKRYYREIRSWLPVSIRQKNKSSEICAAVLMLFWMPTPKQTCRKFRPTSAPPPVLPQPMWTIRIQQLCCGIFGPAKELLPP